MSDLLGLGTSALTAAQRMLDTIGHNISNVNTPGYSRQTTELSAREATKIGGSFVGSGVDVGAVTRSVDYYITKSLYLNTSNYQQLSTFGSYTKIVDDLLGNSSLGLSNALDDFFTSLNDVNSHPNSIPARQVFLSQGEILNDRFKEVNSQLSKLGTQVNNQVANLVTQINGLANGIAKINSDLTSAGISSGNQPNDLLDRRDELIRQLSELVSVTTVENNSGSIDVFIGSGQALVVGGHDNELITGKNEYDPNLLDVKLKLNNNSVSISDQLTGGQIGGALSVFNSVINPALNAIGRLALTLAVTFNEQHQQGLDLNGNQGGNMFTDPNLVTLARDRVLSSVNNSGTGVFSLSINSMDEPNLDAYSTFSKATSLVNAGTLSGLPNSVTLLLNGVNIRSTVPADDTVSSTDAQASAIAISNAINASTSQHGITAVPQANLLNLGQFTAGAFAAGEFQINGVNVVTAGTDRNQLVQDINALSSQTGVEASIDKNGNVILVASDGRNIQLTSNANTPVATFEYFDTNSAIALDQVKRSEIKLTVDHGTIEVSGNNPSLVGLTTGDYPDLKLESLKTSDYQLSYDGTYYTLVRLDDNKVMGKSNMPNFNVDGFSLSLDAGTVNAGDKFLVQPTRQGSKSLDYLLLSPDQLALAAPVRTEANINNQGTGAILLRSVNNATGEPLGTSTVLGNAFSTPGKLSPPMSLVFTSSTSFQVYDISQGFPGTALGPEQSYDPTLTQNIVFPISGVSNSTPPGPNATYTFDPGFTISITGQPKAGDAFTLTYNEDSHSDNRNGQKLAQLQVAAFLNNNTSTYQDAFAQLVGEVGSLASKTDINSKASGSLLKSIESRRNDISGVNMDEEAANLIRFQQYYQAATQLINVSRQNFDTLISAFGR